MTTKRIESVLEGEREEWRRILYEGISQWVQPDGEELVLGDGRRVPEAEARYPRALRADEDPVRASELRVACAGIRRYARRDADLLPQADHGDERTPGQPAPPSRLPIPQLRG